jgi:ribosomal protein S12
MMGILAFRWVRGAIVKEAPFVIVSGGRRFGGNGKVVQSKDLPGICLCDA